MSVAPVVFIVFNRPEVTARVLGAIRAARPKTLLVICDGPRVNKPGEAEKVEAVRRVIAEGVDWDCELKTDYSTANLGCRRRIATGLTWVFTQVEEAIILEDDCLPDPTFFTFCTETLARYRDDPRVMHIGGNSFLGDTFPFRASYAASRYPHIWGWATWRRAWARYDARAECWLDPAVRARVLGAMNLSDERGYWGSIFNRVSKNPDKATMWSYQWTLTCWRDGGLSLYPAVNLVENIGLGADATHTTSAEAHLSPPARALSLPLVHPQSLALDPALDRAAFRSTFMAERTFTQRVRQGLRRLGLVRA